MSASSQPSFRNADHARVSKYSCPHCLALPGRYCWTASGKRYGKGEFHSARWRAAQIKYEFQQEEKI